MGDDAALNAVDIDQKFASVTCDSSFEVKGQGGKKGKKGQRVDNLRACMALCDDNDACEFIWLNTKNWCIMYTDCSKHRLAKYEGTTYAKKPPTPKPGPAPKGKEKKGTSPPKPKPAP